MIHRNTLRGFTLIELLVVIAIIGILATLVTTFVASARTRSRNAAAKNDISQMGKAVELFRQDPNNVLGYVIATVDASNATLTMTAAGNPTATGSPLITAIFSGNQPFYAAAPSTSSYYGTEISRTPSISHTYNYRTITPTTSPRRQAVGTSYRISTTVAVGTGVTDQAFCILNGSSVQNSESVPSAHTTWPVGHSCS